MIYEHPLGINLDIGRLAEFFKCSKEEATKLVEKYSTKVDIYTFRALSDTVDYPASSNSPESKFLNAKAWLDRLARMEHDRGFDSGRANTKEIIRRNLGL